MLFTVSVSDLRGFYRGCSFYAHIFVVRPTRGQELNSLFTVFMNVGIKGRVYHLYYGTQILWEGNQ